MAMSRKYILTIETDHPNSTETIIDGFHEMVRSLDFESRYSIQAALFKDGKCCDSIDIKSNHSHPTKATSPG